MARHIASAQGEPSSVGSRMGAARAAQGALKTHPLGRRVRAAVIASWEAPRLAGLSGLPLPSRSAPAPRSLLQWTRYDAGRTITPRLDRPASRSLLGLDRQPPAPQRDHRADREDQRAGRPTPARGGRSTNQQEGVDLTTRRSSRARGCPSICFSAGSSSAPHPQGAHAHG